MMAEGGKTASLDSVTKTIMIKIYKTPKEVEDLINQRAYSALGEFGKWFEIAQTLPEPKYQVILIMKGRHYQIWLRLPMENNDPDYDFLLKFDGSLAKIGTEIALKSEIDEMVGKTLNNT